MPLDRQSGTRWVDTMPVLAGVLRGGEPRCVLHGTRSGQVERETEWGTLYRCADHYTLRERLRESACGRCGSRGVERFSAMRIPPWCPDCKTQLDGFPYHVVYGEQSR